MSEARDDAQLEIDRMALLCREREAPLRVVRPPFAVHILSERDLVGEDRWIPGLLQATDAAIEGDRVVLVVERAVAVRGSLSALAPANAVHGPAVGHALLVNAQAADCFRRVARTRARSVSSVLPLRDDPTSAGGGTTGCAGRRVAGPTGVTRVASSHACRSGSSIRSRPPACTRRGRRAGSRGRSPTASAGPWSPSPGRSA